MNAKEDPIYIWSLPYSATSGGLIALHKLCHILNEIGFKAYVSCVNTNLPGNINAPSLTDKIRKSHLKAGLKPIGVYPEVVRGNDFEVDKVVRWLLNKPGTRNSFNGWSPREWEDDFVTTFDKEFNYPGRIIPDMYISVVNKSVYNTDNCAKIRNGYLVYSDRFEVDFKELPKWLNPITIISKKCLRTPEELASLYKSSKALVVFERTGAGIESIHCGCPVVSVKTNSYIENVYEKYGNNGVSFELSLEGIEKATKTIGKFLEIDKNFDQCELQNVEKVFVDACHFFMKRKISKKKKLSKKLRKAWIGIKGKLRPLKWALLGLPKGLKT